MGGKPVIGGEELSHNADRQALVERLMSAYADEWIAGYYYMLTAQLVQGPLSSVVSEEFRREAVEELTKHARAIAERLASLGAEPPRSFEGLWRLSSCKYPEVPSDPFDIDGFIIAAIKAESCAIKAYRELYDLAHGRDPVTEELAEELLADEVRHRTELTSLLTREGLERLQRDVTG